MDQVRSENITIETKDGKFSGFFAQADPSAPRVLVYHAWWGLTPFFRDLSRRLAEEGFTVFAPDLYDGKTAGTIDEAMAMLKQRDFPRHEFVATSAIQWMQEQPSEYPGLGLVGFSMGGSWSVTLAGAFPELVKAVVLFYGSGAGEFSRMRAHFQGHFAGHDEWETPADMDPMLEGFRANNVQLESFSYPEAQHWFMETNRPEYRDQDTALAWDRAVKFLKKELTGKS